MSILLHPGYFPSIANFVALSQNEEILWEVEDNYQKQTYRNRMYIYGANGRLTLNIPIKHTADGSKQKYKDVQIENSFPWQKNHWKSLESAYRTSPFFEFYEDELRPLFELKQQFLLDFNLKGIALVSELIQLENTITKTSSFQTRYPKEKDHRSLINAKKNPLDFDTYTQVFTDKHGFINNLSILDLLFNEGTNAITYLEEQKLQF